MLDESLRKAAQRTGDQAGYALLNLMEHLDREMDLLNQQRIRVGPSTQEGQRLTQIKRSHLRKLQTCISELNTSGFNDWLLHQ